MSLMEKRQYPFYALVSNGEFSFGHLLGFTNKGHGVYRQSGFGNDKGVLNGIVDLNKIAGDFDLLKIPVDETNCYHSTESYAFEQIAKQLKQ